MSATGPEAPITTLKGIGEKTAALFGKLNITTVDDLLWFYPRAYEAYDAPVYVSHL